MKKYGYIRVSSKDQNLDRQYRALEKYEIEEKNIFLKLYTVCLDSDLWTKLEYNHTSS